MPQEFGAWPTVHNRFRQWRDAGVFEALLEGFIAEAAKRGEVGLSLVSVDSITARAHHDAAGMQLGPDIITALVKAAARGEGLAKGGGPEGQDGRDTESDPEGEGRRRIRRRRELWLKAALLGCSKGGQTGKVHPAAGRKCRPLKSSLAFVLTAGQAADSPQFIPVLGKVRVRGPAAAPAPGPTRSPGTRPTRSAATAPTCANATSSAVTDVSWGGVARSHRRRGGPRWPAE